MERHLGEFRPSETWLLPVGKRRADRRGKTKVLQKTKVPAQANGKPGISRQKQPTTVIKRTRAKTNGDRERSASRKPKKQIGGKRCSISVKGPKKSRMVKRMRDRGARNHRLRGKGVQTVKRKSKRTREIAKGHAAINREKKKLPGRGGTRGRWGNSKNDQP